MTPEYDVVFADELAALGVSLRSYVGMAFQKFCPPWFWYVSASMSGQHHPSRCRRLGGLVEHTKLAVAWAIRLMDRLTGTGDALTNSEREQVIAALLLHGRWTASCLEQMSLVTVDPQPRIVEAVKYHMGRWGADRVDSAALSAVADVVQLADYCAAQSFPPFDPAVGKGGGA